MNILKAATQFAISAFAGAAIVTAPGTAAQAQAPRGAPNSFAELVEDLSPAVVNIATAQNIARRDNFGGQGPFPEGSPFERFNEFFDRGGQAPRRMTSLGSGFVIDPGGIIVTNNHVIEGADEITVTFGNGDTAQAELVGRDEATDLAVLRVEVERELPYVEWGDSDTARVGDWVLAIGNPFGLGQTVTAGIVSARSRDIRATRYDEFIQTDASINQGNSGGPLFDLNGQVIGVNTAIISPSGGSIGIGFAVPSNLASRYVSQLIEYGETVRGWLGVTIEPVTADLAEAFGFDHPTGAVVTGVTEGGPADEAGLEIGDVILRFGDREIENPRELSRIVAETEPGDTVRIEILREERRRTLRATIERLETSPLAASGALGDSGGAPVRPSSASEALGLTLEPITEENRRRFRIDDSVSEGVVVTHVDPRSDAARTIQPGDVITEIAYESVANPDEAVDRIAKVLNEDDKPVLLRIVRDGRPGFRAVRAK
ncbi:MAG: DegQ family serine endoprotease [Parvularculaceae bacterium]